MSTPIRRTAARLAFTGAMTMGSAGLLAGPVLAQYPPDQIDVTVTTPGATIEVTGEGWNENTTVTISYEEDDNVEGDSPDAQAATPASVTATVDEDGSFTAPLEVPEDAAGSEITYTISGTDDQGQERTETRALNVQLTSAEMGADTSTSTELAAPAPAEDGDGALLAVAAAGVVALAGGATVARRRVQKD